MFATDPAPKTQCKPNKIKVDPDQPLMALDEELECELKAFHAKLHAEWWKDTDDWLLGPHVFLNHHQIKHLCHLAHADSLANIDDLKNNFKWNWMDDHGVDLLHLIHNVYGFSPSPHLAQDSDLLQPDSSIDALSSKLPAAPPTASDLKAKKSRAKMGPGSQHCSACGTLGHKSTFAISPMQLAFKKNSPVESNPQCPKALSQARFQEVNHFRAVSRADFE